MKLPLISLLVLLAYLARAGSNDIVIADFEGNSFGDWTAQGEAFAAGPSAGAYPGQKAVRGYFGKQLANSFNKGDAMTGRLLSPEFKIERSYIRFMIGGAELPKVACLNLMLNGKIVRTATGLKSKNGRAEALRFEDWDVDALKDKLVRIEIVDEATALGGHILVDNILQTDEALKQSSFDLPIEKNFLLLPVKNRSRNISFRILQDDASVREFEMELAVENKPDWWAFYDMRAFHGHTLHVQCLDKLPGDLADAIPALFQPSDQAVAATNLYQEALRPQFHYTVRRGYNNDPNGLTFFNGEYHMFYQYNPFGIDWGNMHWGHAVSPDLIHWTELAPAIYPHSLASPAFSGGATVDHDNRLGYGQGKEDVLIASYSSIGRGEFIVTGTGRALTLNPIPEDPVLIHKGWDPHVFRYEPADKWMMVVFEKVPPKYGYAIYDSKDLKSWHRLCFIEGFQDCPDLFELPVEGDSAHKWILYGHKKDADKRYASRSSYMIGAFEGTTFTPETEIIEGHCGPDFYAGQTFSSAPNERRVMIAWLSGASYPGMPFSQGMTVPLQLKLRRTPAGLRLCFTPVPEMEQLHGRHTEGRDISLADANALLTRETAELLDIDLDLVVGTVGKVVFLVHGKAIDYDVATQELSCGETKATLAPDKGHLRLRVLVDRAVLELYANDGLVAMAFGGRIFSDKTQLSLQGAADVKVHSIRVSEMKSIWTNTPTEAVNKKSK